MEKVILTVAIALLALCGFSQSTTISIYQVDVLIYNQETSDYKLYKSSYPIDMKLTKHGNMFIIDNKDESNYRITKNIESDDKECYNFLGTDKDNKDIGMQFCFDIIEQKGTMTILYLKEMIVIYSIKP
jgi:hypothetical protein